MRFIAFRQAGVVGAPIVPFAAQWLGDPLPARRPPGSRLQTAIRVPNGVG